MTETDRCTAWWDSFTCTEPADHEGPHREYVRGEGGVARAFELLQRKYRVPDSRGWDEDVRALLAEIEAEHG